MNVYFLIHKRYCIGLPPKIQYMYDDMLGTLIFKLKSTNNKLIFYESLDNEPDNKLIFYERLDNEPDYRK